MSHFDGEGRALMVDVCAKGETVRRAVAEGCIRMASETLAAITGHTAQKGDVLAVAQLAAIMAAKRTADLIPLCHPVPLGKVSVRVVPDPALPGVRAIAEVKTSARTGVEMEALTAVSVACLTVYDMVKAMQKDMVIGPIRLLHKHGGASGDYVAPAAPAAAAPVREDAPAASAPDTPPGAADRARGTGPGRR